MHLHHIYPSLLDFWCIASIYQLINVTIQNIKKDLVEAAEDYMQKNPQSDRRVIDKVLRSRYFITFFLFSTMPIPFNAKTYLTIPAMQFCTGTIRHNQSEAVIYFIYRAICLKWRSKEIKLVRFFTWQATLHYR